MTQQSSSTAIVTEQELSRCHRVIDLNKQEVFYLVESERDPLVEYAVRALCIKGEYHLTCTCPAGLSGSACKHKRWATAHAQEYKAEQKALAAREERVLRLMAMGLTQRQAREAVAASFIVDGKPADDQTLVRVFGPHKQPSAWEVERDAYRYQGCSFSLLK